MAQSTRTTAPLRRTAVRVLPHSGYSFRDDGSEAAFVQSVKFVFPNCSDAPAREKSRTAARGVFWKPPQKRASVRHIIDGLYRVVYICTGASVTILCPSDSLSQKDICQDITPRPALPVRAVSRKRTQVRLERRVQVTGQVNRVSGRLDYLTRTGWGRQTSTARQVISRMLSRAK